MSPQTSKFKTYFAAALDLAMMWTIRLFPLSYLPRIGGFLGQRASHRSKLSRRKEMAKVAQILFPEETQAKHQEMIDRNWSFIGQSMLQIADLKRVLTKTLIHKHGVEHLISYRDTKRAAIIAFVHTGLWEMCFVGLAENRILPITVYQAPSNKLRAKIARKMRLRTVDCLHPQPTNNTAAKMDANFIEGRPQHMRKILRGLQNGEFLWMAVDECINGHVSGPWFAKNWRRQGNLETVGRLAKKTGAVIIPTWCVNNKDGSSTVTYSPPIEPENLTAQELTELTASRLRVHIEEHFEQWFMFHELRVTDFESS